MELIKRALVPPVCAASTGYVWYLSYQLVLGSGLFPPGAPWPKYVCAVALPPIVLALVTFGCLCVWYKILEPWLDWVRKGWMLDRMRRNRWRISRERQEIEREQVGRARGALSVVVQKMGGALSAVVRR
jgi:hypothetical protein